MSQLQSGFDTLDGICDAGIGSERCCIVSGFLEAIARLDQQVLAPRFGCRQIAEQYCSFRPAPVVAGRIGSMITVRLQKNLAGEASAQRFPGPIQQVLHVYPAIGAKCMCRS